MVNWIAGNWPDRFKCLVTHDGNLDERFAYFATEELWFPEWEHGGTPWENPQGYAKHNPVDFVKNWKTPMLVVHGAKDYRVVETGGFAAFTALQRQGIPEQAPLLPGREPLGPEAATTASSGTTPCSTGSTAGRSDGPAVKSSRVVAMTSAWPRKEFDEVVALMYRATTEHEHWTSVLEKIGLKLGATIATVHVHARAGDVEPATTVGAWGVKMLPDLRGYETYYRDAQRLGPPRRAQLLKPGAILTGEQMRRRDEILLRSEGSTPGFLRPLGVRYSIRADADGRSGAAFRSPAGRTAPRPAGRRRAAPHPRSGDAAPCVRGRTHPGASSQVQSGAACRLQRASGAHAAAVIFLPSIGDAAIVDEWTRRARSVESRGQWFRGSSARRSRGLHEHAPRSGSTR